MLTLHQFINCARQCGGEASHHMIKRSHKCKGHTVQRTASSQSPSYNSCLSECSLVWVGQSSSCMRRWSCKSHSVHSHWFQRVPAHTFLKHRYREIIRWAKQFIRDHNICVIVVSVYSLRQVGFWVQRPLGWQDLVGFPTSMKPGWQEYLTTEPTHQSLPYTCPL